MPRPISTLIAAALALGGLTAAAPAVAAPDVAVEPRLEPATSSTSLTLSSTRTPYGRTVTASAAVAVSSGRAEGDIWFVVDAGAPVKANLGAAGTARLVLPGLGVGSHAVTASFVPQFAEQQQGSTSPVQAWTIDPVRTRLQVRVIGRGARIPTSVRVQADGDFGTRPTGQVRVAVTRAGGREVRTDVATLPSDGVVRVRLGTLRKGGYRAVVTYAGDGQHLRERRVQRFRVVQR